MKLTKFPIVKVSDTVRDKDGDEITEKSLIVSIEAMSKTEIKALEHIEVNGVTFWNMNKK